METIKLHQNEIEYLINSVETCKQLGNDRMLAEIIINKLHKVKKCNTPRVVKSLSDLDGKTIPTKFTVTRPTPKTCPQTCL